MAAQAIPALSYTSPQVWQHHRVVFGMWYRPDLAIYVMQARLEAAAQGSSETENEAEHGRAADVQAKMPA